MHQRKLPCPCSSILDLPIELPPQGLRTTLRITLSPNYPQVSE